MLLASTKSEFWNLIHRGGTLCIVNQTELDVNRRDKQSFCLAPLRVVASYATSSWDSESALSAKARKSGNNLDVMMVRWLHARVLEYASVIPTVLQSLDFGV